MFKSWKNVLIAALIGLVAGLGTGAFVDPGIFESFAYSVRGPAPEKISDSISLILLDPELLNREYNPVTGGFNRGIYPRLLERIASESPKVVVLDVILHSASATEDIALLEALASISPVIFADQFKTGQDGPAFLLADRPGFPGSISTGYVNLPIETGRIVRSMMPILSAEGSGQAHLALVAARRFLDTEEAIIRPDHITLVNRDPQRPQVTIPLGADGHARIHFRGAPYPMLRGSTLLREPDPQLVKALCAGKVVLIGAADERMGDRLLTPFHLRSPQLPQVFGVEVLATIFDNIISADFLYEPSSAVRLLMLLVFAGVGALLMKFTLWVRLVAAGSALLVTLLASLLAFSQNCLFDPAPLLAAIAVPLILPLFSGQRAGQGVDLSTTGLRSIGGEPVSAPVVFISYRSIDKDLAFEMVACLESSGLPCWIAPRNIVPGRSFPTEIVAGLEATAVLVLLFSGSDNLSRHILSEVSHAFDLGRPIIVFKTSREMPDATFGYFLKLAHWLDTTAGTPAQSFPELVKAVRTHITDQAALKR